MTVTADYNRNQPMSKANINGVEIAFTQAGDEAAPAVLLINGMSASHRYWEEAFVNAIVAAGYRVVLMDNRDTGESDRLDHLGRPKIWWQTVKATLGLTVDAPYELKDMARDAIGVLDALDIDRAHLVGASMGGMIAQIVASEYPQRTRSLVSIMSTTGAPHLPRSSGGAQSELLGLTDSTGDQKAQLEENGMFPSAMPRQVMAIVAAGDRSDQVSQISAPTLVLHGGDDQLMLEAHGQHTHQLIKGSTFIVYAGMGHDIPTELVPRIVRDMDRLFASTN